MRAIPWPWLWVVLLASVSGWAAGVRSQRVVNVQPERSVQPAVQRDEHVGSGTCRACHPGAWETWHDTFHRTMTQRPDDTAILGAFDGQVLGPDARHRVGRDRSGWWVEAPGDDGQPERRSVVLVTGAHHMQVYWTRPQPDDGRLEAFAWAWLVDEARWVPNEATLLRPPAEPTTFTWNRVCIKCHVVEGVPGYDQSTDHVASTVAELGIACEACHGPARRHVERHRSPVRRYLRRLDAEPDDAIVHPGRLGARAGSQVCAQCHSITVFHDEGAWVQQGHDSTPPDPISTWGSVVRHPLRSEQTFVDGLLDDDPDFFADRFWTDGMVRVSGREYNGLIESPCAVDEEFGCLSCHRMHDSDPDDQLSEPARTTAGAMCSGCHKSIASDVQAHSHHAASSEGSQCENCHMPHTTYGLLKAIRSHQIDSPTLAATLSTGRPNACNLCHLDRSLSWTAEYLSAWYGQPPPDEPVRDDLAASIVWLIAGDAGQRALVAWHLGWQPAIEASGADWAPALLAEVLEDPYAAVRLVAARALGAHPGFESVSIDPLFDSEAAEQVREIWARSARSRAADGVPVSEAGVDRAAIEALRATRDERPVALAE